MQKDSFADQKAWARTGIHQLLLCSSNINAGDYIKSSHMPCHWMSVSTRAFFVGDNVKFLVQLQGNSCAAGGSLYASIKEMKLETRSTVCHSTVVWRPNVLSSVAGDHYRLTRPATFCLLSKVPTYAQRYLSSRYLSVEVIYHMSTDGIAAITSKFKHHNLKAAWQKF